MREVEGVEEEAGWRRNGGEKSVEDVLGAGERERQGDELAPLAHSNGLPPTPAVYSAVPWPSSIPIREQSPVVRASTMVYGESRNACFTRTGAERNSQSSRDERFRGISSALDETVGENTEGTRDAARRGEA